MERRALTAVAVAALLLASGCTGLNVLADDAETPPDVDVTDQYASLDALAATQVTAVDTGNGTNETRARVHIDFTGEQPRQHQRVLAPESRAGDVTVVDESGSLLYDASDDEVTRIPDTGGDAAGNRAAYLARVVAAAGDDDEVPNPSAGVSPLPVVPRVDSASSVPENVIDGFDVEYRGTETVAGRTAHGFELTAASEAALAVNRTLWLDNEYYYPLKTHQTTAFQNRTVETTTRLVDVTFDADLPADVFDFDVPKNATVETLDLSVETFDSVAALRDRANFSVPEPDVPDGYGFDEARYFGENASQATLRYATADGERLAVTKMDYVSNASSDVTAGEPVTVDGREGRYLTTAQAKLVSWSCEDAQFSVTATDLDEAALLAVAESVGCA